MATFCKCAAGGTVHSLVTLKTELPGEAGNILFFLKPIKTIVIQMTVLLSEFTFKSSDSVY